MEWRRKEDAEELEIGEKLKRDFKIESRTGEKDRKREKLVQHLERNLLKEKAGKSWGVKICKLEKDKQV